MYFEGKDGFRGRENLKGRNVREGVKGKKILSLALDLEKCAPAI